MKQIVLLLAVLAVPLLDDARAEGTIGVYFDPEATMTVATPPLFTTQEKMYFAVNGIPEGEILGFEFDSRIDPHILLFGFPGIPIGSPQCCTDIGPFEFIVSLSQCAPASGPTVLVEWNFGIFAPEHASDMEICLLEASPSSFSPPVPGYLTCDSELRTLSTVPSPCPEIPPGCAVLYPTCTVATESESWGTVRSRF